MKEYHVVTIELAVNDAAALHAAAERRALADNAPTEGLKTPDGEIDTCACLQMLLDPGSLEGCEIENSSAEAVL